jgi:hypothetical protein
MSIYFLYIYSLLLSSTPRGELGAKGNGEIESINSLK